MMRTNKPFWILVAGAALCCGCATWSPLAWSDKDNSPERDAYRAVETSARSESARKLTSASDSAAGSTASRRSPERETVRLTPRRLYQPPAEFTEDQAGDRTASRIQLASHEQTDTASSKRINIRQLVFSQEESADGTAPQPLPTGAAPGPVNAQADPGNAFPDTPAPGPALPDGGFDDGGAAAFGDFGGSKDAGSFGQSMTEGEDMTGAKLTFEVVQDPNQPPMQIFEVLYTLFFSDRFFVIYGDDAKEMEPEIRANTIEDAMNQFMDQSNTLVVKRGSQWIVYADGAEEDPDLRNTGISFVYKCRRAKAADLISVLDGEAPEGFPAAGDPFIGEPNVPAQAVGSASSLMGANGIEFALGKDVQYQVVHHMNGIILQGELRDIRRAVEFLKMIDQPIPRVSVELLIVQYFHENGFAWRYNLLDGQIARGDAPVSNGADAGIELMDNNDNTFGPKPFGINVERLALSAASGGGPLHFSSIGQLTGAFKQNVQLLVKEDLARIVTNPHVAVVNGQQGNILLNEKFNFFTNIVQPISGTVDQQQQELNNVTALSVTPTIVGPDNIHLAVNATVSAFVGDITGGGLQTGLPNQRINDIATAVVLEDNETLIIGGLVKEEITEERDKIPGVSDIPVIGQLFKGTNTTRRFTETVIYLTPRLVLTDSLEDEFVEQVFRETDRLHDRGEYVRDQHRRDRLRQKAKYQMHEDLDRQKVSDLIKHEFRKRPKYSPAPGTYYDDEDEDAPGSVQPEPIPDDAAGGAMGDFGAGDFGGEPVDAFGAEPVDAFGAEPVNAPGAEPVDAFGAEPVQPLPMQPIPPSEN